MTEYAVPLWLFLFLFLLLPLAIVIAMTIQRRRERRADRPGFEVVSREEAERSDGE